ncbi:cysteine desulfurase family protein [Corynebacterium gerontici]|uniref:Cysteine desulfurase n=1 Tax=Corynebacterium gerontici TaxID=2079234 RepID=A0A3G6IZQ1_9CORY|nr:cysteine desulfurase family protein [Corynebacterium gerontici]AZA11259.1 Cysteine desulfurase [Corynebacterium gerontici]
MPHYFDHAATTPMREAAKRIWLEHASALNPGGQYASGRKARSVLDSAREEIATLLGCDPIEVIFCASGTEADNLALQGLWRRSGGTIAASGIEHPAVLETVRGLEHQGAAVRWLPVSSKGEVHEFESTIQGVDLITCMWANNETGALQPVQQICDAAGDAPVHVDAVQAVGHVPVDFHALGATTLAASAHKFGGPRGLGILLAKRSPAPSPVLFGGGQERGIRPGTNDVAAAAATAAALKEAVAEMEAESQRLRSLQTRLLDVVASIENTQIHTPDHCLPGHVHASFLGAEADSLIMLLDSQGFEASTGSACSNGVNRASEVLLSMGVPVANARSAIRFSLGYTTTTADVEALIRALPDVVARARLAGMA